MADTDDAVLILIPTAGRATRPATARVSAIWGGTAAHDRCR
ncbi:hypothetical protein I551_8808 [Mycobacterium ulcerans str. Harvey]|uniref:Uncharacterized protein n=1 Tax=Mycobacterium ulcerans str. Harvey TaxID=1299332 RepID=A0ABN0RA31_MYCUL|nr:hypothetical protein I551_8808 [Mycobacterium ulcerans str. Harvey]